MLKTTCVYYMCLSAKYKERNPSSPPLVRKSQVREALCMSKRKSTARTEDQCPAACLVFVNRSIIELKLCRNEVEVPVSLLRPEISVLPARFNHDKCHGSAPHCRCWSLVELTV